MSRLRAFFCPPSTVKILPILLVLAHIAPGRADNGNLPVSITEQYAFTLQDPCGQGCLYNTATIAAAQAINLNYHCSSNACYCATQNQHIYTSFITSCWSYACYNLVSGDPLSTIPVDIALATSIYYGYCLTAYPYANVGDTTPVTSVPSTTMISNNAIVTVMSTVTAASNLVPGMSTSLTTTTPTTSSRSSSPTGVQSGLSPGTIGGIAGGIVAALIIGILASVVFVLCLRMRRKARSAPNVDSPQRHPPEYPYGGYDQKAELALSPSHASSSTQDYQMKQEINHNSRAAELGNPIEGKRPYATVYNEVAGPAERDRFGYRAELDGTR